MFRVIIAGSRDFSDYQFLREKMDRLLSNVKEPIAVVCGKARGADTLGERYALERGYEVLPFPANWERYGRSAGYRRNVQMAENADALVAFWDGKSMGTRHMISAAKSHGLRVRVVKFKEVRP